MPVVGRPFAAEEDVPGGNPPRAWSSDRICRLGAIATTVFLLYGGLLPFNLRRPDPLHPIAWLEQVRFTPWALAPTTDRAVNAVLGIPLGFFFMGVVRTGRGKRLSPGLALLVVLCASATLGASVELLQVLLPGRLSSWNDVVGQLLGVGVGTLGWNVAGKAIIQWLHDLATEREARRLAARVVQLYLPIYVIAQLRPSESELGLTFPVLRDFAGAVLLSIPIGALGVLGSVRSGTSRPVWHAVLLGMSIVAAAEIVHGLLWSSHASTIDVVAGTLGMAIGIATTVAWTGSRAARAGSRFRRRTWLLLATVWTLFVIGAYWYPFDFRLAPDGARLRLAHLPLIPFASYYPSYSAAPLQGLWEILWRFLVTVPLGWLVCSAWRGASEGRFSIAITAGVATTLMLAIGVGEFFLAAGFPDMTEVVLGVMGAAVGGAIATAFARCQVAPSPAAS
jgi:glycopeptide antibiotics resistance protein